MKTQPLERLETTLGQALVTADALGGKKPWVPAILSAMRKLRIMRELQGRDYIAITGTQGAGKTRLLRGLYDLDTTWLEDNPGRGEKVPVFIVESRELQSPQGRILKLDAASGAVVNSSVSPDEFKEHCRSWANSPEDIFPTLHVPERYFNGQKIGFVLLPGFEQESAQNRIWQQLMSHVLQHAAGSIIVTDQMRLAEHSQAAVLQAATTERALPGRKPMIAISRTENTDETTRQSLVKRAAECFKVDAAELDRIICTGAFPWPSQAWAEPLVQTTMNYVVAGMDRSDMHLNSLEEVLDGEIPVILEDIREAFLIEDIRSSPGEQTRDRILEVFSEANAKYRLSYERNIRHQFRTHATAAKDKAKKRYSAEEEGFLNNVASVPRWFSHSKSEREDIHTRRIAACWSNPEQDGADSSHGSHHVLRREWVALSKQSQEFLGLSADLSELPPEAAGDARHLLGYAVSDDQKVSVFENDETRKELRKLLQTDVGEIPEDGYKPLQNEQLEAVIRMVPSLTMEYLRINQSLVLSNFDKLPERPDVQSLGSFMADVSHNLTEAGKTYRNIALGIGSILAVDVARDGTIDTIPALFEALFGSSAATTAAGTTGTGAAAAVGTGTGTATATSLGATMAMTVGGIVIAGIVGYQLTQHVQKLDAAHRGYIVTVIDQLAEEHVQRSLEKYDLLMERIEDRIRENLGRAYRLGHGLASKDNILRALARLDRTRLSALAHLRGQQQLLA